MNVDWLDQIDSYRLVEKLLAETAAPRSGAPTGAGLTQAGWLASGPSVALPRGPLVTIGFNEVLAARLSVRAYSPRPVEAAAVACILDAANEFDERMWPEEGRLAPRLQLLLLAQRVQGVGPGFYVHDPSRQLLIPIAPISGEEVTKALFLQEEFSLAPAVFVVVGALSAALRAGGSHAHRELLLRAGAAAHQGMLAALGMGLGGCLFAGLVADSWRKIIDVDGYSRIALFACAVGYAHDEGL